MSPSAPRLTESSMTDDLTGLMSRQHFTEAMSRAFSFAARHDEPLSLIVLEVDHFEAYNDLHGDRAGDAILQALARVLREQVRAYDVVAHYGRGKFAVLLPAAVRRDILHGRWVMIQADSWPSRMPPLIGALRSGRSAR